MENDEEFLTPKEEKQRAKQALQQRDDARTCKRLRQHYRGVVGRNLAVYRAKARAAIGLNCLEFWAVGTVLHQLVVPKAQSNRTSKAPSKTEPVVATEALPAVRRLVGPHGSFDTSDEMLLFCLYYTLAGWSQNQLALHYFEPSPPVAHDSPAPKSHQPLISQWWRKSQPFFWAALRACCQSTDTAQIAAARRMRSLARAAVKRQAQERVNKRGLYPRLIAHLTQWLPPAENAAQA